MRRPTSSLPDSAAPPAAPADFPGQLAFGKMLAILLAIVAVALALRFTHLDRWGLWVDEIFTVQHAGELADGDINTRSLAYALSLIGFEADGVDMVTLESEKVWTWRDAGINEWNIRAPIALLGGLTILALGLLAHRSFSSRTTLLLCLLMALSPWHLWMSQVGRFYMQLFLLYNVGLLLYFQATEEGQVSRAFGATVAIVLAFFTTPIALMIFGILGLDIVLCRLRRRPSGMRPAFWIIAAVGLALCVAGVAVTFVGRAKGVAGFIGSPQPIPVMTMGLFYMVGVPIATLAAFGFRCTWVADERLATLLAVSALLPVAIFVGFNLLGVDTHVRYMFVTLFAWLALAAAGLDALIAALQPRWGRLAAWIPALAFLGTFALADYIYMTGGAGYRGPWRQAMAYVDEHRQPGDLVGGDLVAHLMAQYYLEDSEVLLLPARDTHVDTVTSVGSPAWLVYRVYQPSTGNRAGALEVPGELRAYFNNRIAEPYHAINVYYYRPPTKPGG